MAINVNRIVDPIIKSIEDGVIPWRREWAPASGLPQNHVHNVPYKGTNILSCWVHQMAGGYTSTRYLTMKQIKDLGLQLKGEKGDPIRRACPIIYWGKQTVTDDDGKEKERWAGNIYNAFNLDQIEGIEDPDTQPIHNHDPSDVGIAIKLTKALNIEVEKGEPAYAPHRDVIKMPDLARFTTTDAFCTTLAHECVHATGHKSRLDRDMSHPFGSDEYAKEELIAELGAAFIAAEWGISSQLENHASYLDNWLKVLKAEPKALITASTAAQKAYSYIKEQLTVWDLHQDPGPSLAELLAYDTEAA